MTPSRRLNLSVQYVIRPEDVPARPAIFRWARAALNVDGMKGGQITVRFVAPEEGRDLNRDYRGKDYTTNVLSFPYDQEPVVFGDLVISPDVVRREAAEQGIPTEAHYAHLVVHGMLHLQGYDHENDQEAEVMEGREREILATLGYPDPYAAERGEPPDQAPSLPRSESR
ncbi:rRNA maturation RNase YbeY [Azospira inquinata]|uniref:Endoribonuclease YbeY n=1 Tax=Azospira inquinata TaxID=2785627 RepID=A0A975XVL1_9RHOO|nr:rRNA maturation RNase YbeY [Azospira inquinata]QWT47409.1 rRNA maturation RNase YbeY [Azospira inquinata]QWT49968.1 rRNA maturation RNase YbeY [Azospira inquinata]